MNRSQSKRWLCASLLLAVVLAILGAGVLTGQVAAPEQSGRHRTTLITQEQYAAMQQQLQGQQPLEEWKLAWDTPLAVKVQGWQVAVFARAKVYDVAPGKLYVWLLRIHTYGKQPKLLREHHYLDQAIQLAGGQTEMQPAFNDLITLDPGTYRLELIFYSVPIDYQFRQFKRGADILRQKGVIGCLSRNQKVVIAD
jgi:hypothetical protein